MPGKENSGENGLEKREDKGDNEGKELSTDICDRDGVNGLSNVEHKSLLVPPQEHAHEEHRPIAEPPRKYVGINMYKRMQIS